MTCLVEYSTGRVQLVKVEGGRHRVGSTVILLDYQQKERGQTSEG